MDIWDYTEEQWRDWFPRNTDAWKDYCMQASKLPHVHGPVGLGRYWAQRVDHPRMIGDDWYVDASKPIEPPKGAVPPKELVAEEVQKHYHNYGQWEKPVSEDVKQRYIKGYWDSVGKKRLPEVPF